MSGKMTYPFTLKIEINQDAMKKLVESGRMTNFMEEFSIAVGPELKRQVVEGLLKSSIDKKVAGMIQVNAGFNSDGDNEFGGWVIKGPIHGPMPRAGLKSASI